MTRPWRVLAVASAAVFVAALDTTIVIRGMTSLPISLGRA